MDDVLDDAKYYHVRISLRDEEDDETAIDLTAEQLRNLVLDPYRRGVPMMIDGRAIPIDDVSRVRIGESAELAVSWFGALRAEVANLRLPADSGPSLEWRAAARARDVSQQLITGPPGAGGGVVTTGLERAAALTPVGVRANSLFLVAGRDDAIVSAVAAFLRSLNVSIVEWPQAVALTGDPTPYVGDVVQAGMGMAQATLVLLTPDDVTHLREDLLRASDGAEERTRLGQARPNVLYEAGIADCLGRGRTIIVKAGPVKPFSDIAGRYVLSLDGRSASRHELVGRLRAAGLSPDQTGGDWLAAGDIEQAIAKAEAALAT